VLIAAGAAAALFTFGISSTIGMMQARDFRISTIDQIAIRS